MGDIFSGMQRNNNFHYLNATHNRFRLLEDLAEFGLHLDKDGFTRCNRYNPNTMRYNPKAECRKCTNGGRSSIFYIGNAENVDTKVVKVLALTNQLSNDLNKLKTQEHYWPNDPKNGYSIDIVKLKVDNRTTYKAHKFKNEPVNKAALGKMIKLEKAVGITEEEMQAMEGYNENNPENEPENDMVNIDDIKIESDDIIEDEPNEAIDTETEGITVVANGSEEETPDPEVPDIEKLAEEDEFGEEEVPELDEDYD
jgi:hypothetical protein